MNTLIIESLFLAFLFIGLMALGLALPEGTHCHKHAIAVLRFLRIQK